ncbi:hypothetical protein OAE61_00800 [Verrucomicrobiales bacterium]|nr:hypothetical protein [Verrucomicrobiales bacterium]
MKSRSVVWLGMVAGVLFSGTQATAGPFSEHPIFSKLIGSWSASGELSGATSDEKIPITETWKGVIGDDGILTLSGNRTMNGEDQKFTWTYSYNAASEIFECEYTHTGIETPLRFELSIATPTRTTDMKTPFGDNGTLAVKNVLAKDGDSIDAEVKILDAQGQALVSGTVKHTRDAAN